VVSAAAEKTKIKVSYLHPDVFFQLINGGLLKMEYTGKHNDG
jgi:hypothetical protein